MRHVDFKPSSETLTSSDYWLKSLKTPVMLLAASTLALSACSSVPPPIEVRTVPIELPQTQRPNLPRPEPLNLQSDFVWTGIREGAESPFSGFVISAETLRALILNNAEVARWIDDANARLDYYEADEPPARDQIDE